MSDVNINWKVQSFFYNKLKNIEYLKLNNISVFTSVPDYVKLPYVKISNISISSGGGLNQDLRIFSFSLKVLTREKSTENIMRILEEMYQDLSKNLIGSKYFDISNKEIFSINKIDSVNFNIIEDIADNLWIGNFDIQFCVRIM